MSTKLTITALKKYLRSLSATEIETLICELYKSSDQAKLYFNSVLGSEEELLEKYEKKLERFFSLNNFNMKGAKELVGEVEKLGSKWLVACVLLKYVEEGTEFTNTFGSVGATYYRAMLSAFKRLVEIVNSDKAIWNELEFRIECLVHNSFDIGWGFGDGIFDAREEIVWDMWDEMEE